LSINVHQLSCISRQWNIENLSPISQSNEREKTRNIQTISYSLDSIRYGENLSLLFKCTHKTHPGDTLQMKHIYLSNDETMKDKYVSKTERFHL
jgi:hypothetical protein